LWIFELAAEATAEESEVKLGGKKKLPNIKGRF
jgi:hypothetical protein